EPWQPPYSSGSLLSLASYTQQLCAVFPTNLTEHFWFGHTLYCRQRLTRNALPVQTGRRVRVASSAPIRAGAVTTKDQFVLMPDEKVCREFRIAVEEIIAGVRGHVGPEVWVIREPLVADATGLYRAAWIGCVVSVIGTHVGPERVRVGDEFGPGKRLQH